MNFATAEQALWDEFGVAPTQEWLDLPTGRVRALVTGDGPTVVFVHGASNAASSWISLAAQLRDHRCVLLDRPGCGLSPALPARLASASDLAAFGDAFVAAVADALGEPSLDVVGTSFGGYFALRGTAAAPSRVGKLVTLGWSVGAPIGRAPLLMRIGASPRVSRVTNALPAPKAMVRPMLKQIGLRAAVTSGAFTPVMVNWFHALLRDTNTMRNEVASLPPLLTMRGMNPDVLLGDDVLARVTVPTLLLWGRDDPFGGEAIARRFAARLPAATLEMVDAGHAPWIDDAAGVADRLRTFLA